MESIHQEMNIISVNITNTNGSITPVVLRKQVIEHICPKGEYYNNKFPGRFVCRFTIIESDWGRFLVS
jgi:hypothetical protein